MISKRQLRIKAREQRLALARDVPDFASLIVAFAPTLEVPDGACVGSYFALPDEADAGPLAVVLAGNSGKISYPRVAAKASPLEFHLPVAGEAMIRSAFGVLEPRADWPRARPSVLLVPLLAFDAKGYRLGYGGGFYDRTLAALRTRGRVTAIGVAFAGQQVGQVPTDANDQKLDMVVTELGVRRFG